MPTLLCFHFHDVSGALLYIGIAYGTIEIHGGLFRALKGLQIQRPLIHTVLCSCLNERSASEAVARDSAPSRVDA